VESRLRPRRKVLVANPGPVSPMVSVELHVVDWILQLALNEAAKKRSASGRRSI